MAVPSWKLHLIPGRTRLTEWVTSHFPFIRRTRRSGSGFLSLTGVRPERRGGVSVCCTLLRLLARGLFSDLVGLRRRLPLLVASLFCPSVRSENRV